MILQALVKYYEDLAKQQNKVGRDGVRQKYRMRLN